MLTCDKTKFGSLSAFWDPRDELSRECFYVGRFECEILNFSVLLFPLKCLLKLVSLLFMAKSLLRHLL